MTKLKEPEFVHLHVHSDYSMLDGAATLDKLIARAVKLKMPALAITDHGNMFHAEEFYAKATKAGIKPIIGYEAYCAPKSMLDRIPPTKAAPNNYHLVLLAKNEVGYQNLIHIASEAYLKGFYYRPRVDKDLLRKYSEGLIVSTACIGGEVPKMILANRLDDARAVVRELMDIFGEDNFYFEIQNHGIEEEQKVNPVLAQLAKEFNRPLIATNDSHYLDKDDAEAHDNLLCIGTKAFVSDKKRMRFSGSEFYFKTVSEMQELFPEYPEAIENTAKLASRCAIKKEEVKYHIPKFPIPDEMTTREYLNKLCNEGLTKRYGEITPEIKARCDYELKIIDDMNFLDYFLVVWDFIKYANEQKIPVGPGRGSGAGSIIAYALGITNIDPLKYGLIFERFLNPDRISMPDFDIDFCRDRRYEVIEYVKRKYGEECVCQIITFGRMKAKAVIRDVCRVQEIPLNIADKLSKSIGDSKNIPEARVKNDDFISIIKANPELTKVVDIAERLEGIARQPGVHAAGVVIADAPVTNYCPLFKPTKSNDITTQYDMNKIEDLGLLKMDFLGLQTLTVIQHAIDNIKYSKGVDVNIDEISLDDDEVYKMLWRGSTKAVFQLESPGMTELVMKLQPDCFNDIIALVALYRPGPMGANMHTSYVKCKHGEKPSYLHPMLEPILETTFGGMLYQEQIMAIVKDLAGFTMAQADSLRKGMGKKDPELMQSYRQKFIDGCAPNNIDEKIANSIFEEILYFSGYGFNKSHSACYGLLAYQTAWLKNYYPAEFMAAVMTCDMNNTEKIVRYKEDCAAIGIDVLPPDVNESLAGFAVVNGAIRYGLGGVRGVGEKAVDSMVDVRESLDGKFIDLFQFCENVDTHSMNKGAIESMVFAGAFDSFDTTRAALAEVLPDALSVGAERRKERSAGQATFFDMMEEDNSDENTKPSFMPEIDEWPEHILLEKEKDVLGFYMSSHPLAQYSSVIETYATTNTLDFRSDDTDGDESESNETHKLDGQDVVMAGMIISSKKIFTKKTGLAMSSFVLEDLHGTIDCVIFPDDYERFGSKIATDSILFLRGELDFDRGADPQLKVYEIIELDDAPSAFAKEISITIHADGTDKDVVDRLRSVILKHKGSTPISFEVKVPPKIICVSIRVDEDFYVDVSPSLIDDLEGVIGTEHIKIIAGKPTALIRKRRPKWKKKG